MILAILLRIINVIQLRNTMVITKKLVSTGCAAMIAASMCVPAGAAFATDVDENSNATTNMNILVKGTTVNVDVPAGTIDPNNPPNIKDDPDGYQAWLDATTIIFNEDSTVTAANLPIENKGTTNIILKTVSATGKASTDQIFGGKAWTIHSWDNDTVDYGAMKDVPEFALKIGGEEMIGTDNNVSATLNKVIKSGEKEYIAFDSDPQHRGSFSKEVLEKGAFSATFNFDLGGTVA